MAERAGASSGPDLSLQELRQCLASVTQEFAEDRQRMRALNFSIAPSKKSSYTPEIASSVIINDMKHLLARKRREVKNRQEEANKEKQLNDKERKARLQYEKLLDEKQRKLKEQKEKDERRRICAEEKRKQKQAAEKEKYEAAVSRTLARCNRITDQRPKRWSWDTPIVNTENKSGKTENRGSSSLTRRENKVHSDVDPAQKGSTSGATQYVFSYVSLLILTKEELRASMYFKQTVKSLTPEKLEITSLEKVETPLMEDIEVPTNETMNVSAKVDVPVHPTVNVEVPLRGKVEDTPEVNVKVYPEANIEVPTNVNIQGSPKSDIEKLSKVRMDASSNIELSPIASMNSFQSTSIGSSSLESVEISPVVSMDTSPETSIHISPESSVDLTSTEVLPVINKATSFEKNTKMHLEAIAELSLEPNGEASPKVNEDTSPKNQEMDKNTSNLTTTRLPPSNIVCYRWLSSPTVEWNRPSMKNMKNLKCQLLAPLEISSKLSAQCSVPNNYTTVQNLLHVSNTIDTVKKMKEIITKASKKLEAARQESMANEASGSESMPNNEEAMNIWVERQHPPCEQKDKEEKEECQKVKTPSVVGNEEDAVTEKSAKSQDKEFPTTSSDELLDQDLTKPQSFEQLEDLEQQKVNTTVKSQDDAKMHKKAYKKIMSQKCQGKLERNKSRETSDDNTSVEDEADDEEETESDDDYFSDVFASGIKPSTKLKTFSKSATRKPRKLVFLKAETGEIHTEREVYFNVDVDKEKDPKAKGSRISRKKRSTCSMRNRKAEEARNSIQYTHSDNTNHWWGHNRIIDIGHNIRSLPTLTTATSNHQNLKDSMTSYQHLEAPSEQKKITKPTAPWSKESPQLHFTKKTTNFKPSSAARGDFGKEEEDSD